MKMDKLVQEIGDTFKAMDLNQFYAGQLDQVVESAIARIGEAVLSGECADLDKLLGVVGRLEQEPRTTFYSRGVERSLQGWIRNRFKQGARTFIAVGRAK